MSYKKMSEKQKFKHWEKTYNEGELDGGDRKWFNKMQKKYSPDVPTYKKKAKLKLYKAQHKRRMMGGKVLDRLFGA